MKTSNIYFITTLLLCSLYSNCFSQEKPQKIKAYRIWVSGQVDVNGIFYEATDSSIIILPETKNWEEIDKKTLIEVNIKDISKVKLRKSNSVRNGAIIGFVPMAIAGGFFMVLAARTGDDFAETEDVMVGVLIFGTAGAGIGAAIGSIKKKYKIDYSKDLYMNKRVKFERKSLKAHIH